MEWNIHYDICAIFIVVIIMALFLYKKNDPSRANKLFLCLMVVAFLATVFDVLSVYTISLLTFFPIWINKLLNTLYFLFFNAVPFVYLMYVLCTIWKIQPFTKWNKIIIGILAAVDLFFILTTPITGLIFHFDDNGHYYSGVLQPILFAVSFVVLSICLYQTVHNRIVLSRMQRVTVYFFTMANIIAVVIQMLLPDLLVVNFTIALGIMLIYITLQNPEDFIDVQTRAYNHTAFVDVVSSYIHGKRSFEVIVLKLDAFHYINETAGIEVGNLLLRMVAEYLERNILGHEVYRISGVKFAIVLHGKGEQSQKLIESIEEHFKQPVEVGKMEIYIKLLFCVVQFPEHVKSQWELENAIQYCMNEAQKKEGRKILYANEEMIQQMKRDAQLNDILKLALEKHKFEVYYQPIWNVKNKKYSSAEALIRLFDDEYGFISPEVFIPLAEKNGLIIPIGEYVFEKVCQMMNQTDISQYGIDYIEINLSAMQCIQKDLRDRFAEIRQKYQIPAEMINLEITETATIQSSEQLKLFMHNMNQDGIAFSLDDYGSGLASVNYLIHYPFTIVKLDKEMVWAAVKQENAAIILKHTIEMMKALKLYIVAEGVETVQQAATLEEMGCDLFQGYLYAKPMPQNEFVEFLSE